LSSGSAIGLPGSARNPYAPRAFTLLANIIMAWNTYRMQAVIDEASNEHSDDVLSRLAPIE